MFQPARPPLTWSTDASRRARLYGSLYVDETVAISPIRLVCCDSAVSRVSGSSWPGGRNSPLPVSAGPSARNSESNFAFSANWASSIQCRQVEVGPRIALRQAPSRLVVAGLHEEGVEVQFTPVALMIGSCRIVRLDDAVEAVGQEVVGDGGDVDLLGDLTRLEERVAEGLFGLDVFGQHLGDLERVGVHRRPGVLERDTCLLRDGLGVLVGILLGPVEDSRRRESARRPGRPGGSGR